MGDIRMNPRGPHPTSKLARWCKQMGGEAQFRAWLVRQLVSGVTLSDIGGALDMLPMQLARVLERYHLVAQQAGRVVMDTSTGQTWCPWDSEDMKERVLRGGRGITEP